MMEATTRRQFVLGAVASATGAALPGPLRAQAPGGRFSMKFAPHPGMFAAVAGDDYIAQLEFAAEQGFHAWEDNRFADLDVAEQERYGRAIADLDLSMGVFVASGSRDSATLTSGDSARLEAFLADLSRAVDVAARANATWMTVVPGAFDLKLAHGYQMANVVNALRRGARSWSPTASSWCWSR